MSKRIEKLSDQAWDYAYWKSSEGDNRHGILYTERLAELIIKECAGIYVQIDNGNQHLGTYNYLEALQKHFGVEE